MSQSEEESDSGINSSPVIKSRALAFDQLEEPASEQDKSSDESEDESDDAEKSAEEPKVSVAPKPVASKSTALAPKLAKGPATSNQAIKKSKSYEAMIMDAMHALDENKRSGVSIRSIMKYVQDHIEIRENFRSFLFKRAIDKALNADIFVHKSGMGMTGSIAFSAAHKKTMLLEQKKKLKAANAVEKKATSGPKTRKPKAKPKPKKSEPKTEELTKDKNNNQTKKPTATKKPTTKGKKARLSIAVLPKVKAKPRPSARATKAKSGATKATAKKDEPKAVSTKANTKRKPKAAAPTKTAITTDNGKKSKK